MDVFIIVALSTDGFIAKDATESSTKWTSKEDTAHFVETTKQADVLIMGSKTFETFGARPLKGRRMIIYSNSKTYEGVEITNEEPKILLERLKKEGVQKVAVAGGSSIYTLFAESGCVNRIILTIENKTFGQGISLFTKPVDLKLSLKSHTQIGPGTVVLEYTVNS